MANQTSERGTQSLCSSDNLLGTLISSFEKGPFPEPVLSPGLTLSHKGLCLSYSGLKPHVVKAGYFWEATSPLFLGLELFKQSFSLMEEGHPGWWSR